MFQVGLLHYLGLNSGRSVSINVNKTRKHFPETFVFHNVSQFPHGKHCFQCQFLFPRCKLHLGYTAGNFNENPSMCEHEQASTHLIFALPSHWLTRCYYFRDPWFDTMAWFTSKMAATWKALGTRTVDRDWAPNAPVRSLSEEEFWGSRVDRIFWVGFGDNFVLGMLQRRALSKFLI